MGLAVDSKDFRFMGEKVAEMILNNKKARIKVPFGLIEKEFFV
jgi:hypothetical protein